MRIIHLVPGAGTSFYCQNCLRDMALVRAQRALGHDVVVVPMYLPLLSDHADTGADTGMYYGAVGLYLRDRFPLLGKAPAFIRKLLDSPRLLRWASERAGSTRSRDLIGMTLSMLRGEEGKQARELDRLAGWLSAEGRPDVVHLSNALLLGLARRIRDGTGASIVCTLQDEHQWVDAMGEEGAARVWKAMCDRAKDVDLFVSVSRYYADTVRDRLGLTDEKLRVVYMGIDLDGFEAGTPSFDPPVIGYLSRICESLGAGVLADAFMKLDDDERHGGVRLRYAGGWTAGDMSFVGDLRRRFDAAGLVDRVDFVRGFGRADRIGFLRSVSVLSVPVPGGEALGMHLLEALASGVPIVQPDAGGFPELVEATGGGVVYAPNDADSLAKALGELLLDPERARGLGLRGSEAVRERFGVEKMAEEMVHLYLRLAERRRSE